MSVSQKDIALLVGVDRSLVAHALRGDPRVSEVTRQKVRDAAAQLGYTNSANREARVMSARRYGRRLRSNILAIVTPSAFFENVPLTSLPYFAPIILGIEDAAARHDLDVLLCSIRDGRLPRMVSDGAVDGVILLGGVSSKLFGMSIPVVVTNGEVDGLNCVTPDDYDGSRKATEHLISLGHTRIAFLGYELTGDYAVPHRRLAGYSDALRHNGLPIHEDLILANLDLPTEERGERAMHELMRRTRAFTGLVCFNDLGAMGAIKAAQSMGISVPHDLSVVGYDDVSEQYSFHPALTSVAFDRSELGRRAVDIVADACAKLDVDAATQPQVRHETVPVRVVVRESTSLCH